MEGLQFFVLKQKLWYNLTISSYDKVIKFLELRFYKIELGERELAH